LSESTTGRSALKLSTVVATTSRTLSARTAKLADSWAVK
jgi:hypothetical protein